jgi:5-methyltetrahydrofolate--homocysteine methyltransferase
MAEYVRQGAGFVGGCCGTNPDYIRALCAATSDAVRKPAETRDRALCASYTHALDLRAGWPAEGLLTPEDDPVVAEALLTGDVEAIVDRGMDLIDAGVELLTLHADLPDGDEEEILVRLIAGLQEISDCPLNLITENEDVLEHALRRYNGKACVTLPDANSETLQRLLPVVRRYGAVVRVPNVRENPRGGIVERRSAMVTRVLEMAAANGIPARDVLFL